MKPDDIIKSYIPITGFIAEIYGENCEVVLHDLRNLDSSIIAIRNNHITGRHVNDTITDFALEIVTKPEKYKGKDYITNYLGKTKDGLKTLRSSTYFIRDEEDNLIGMLCVNVDITALGEAKEAIEKLLFLNKNNEQPTDHNMEEFSSNIKELVNTKIIKILKQHNIKPSRMLMEEKKEVVKAFKESGIFLIKGAVTEVATQLEVSKQTIYRYLNELDNNQILNVK